MIVLALIIVIGATVAGFIYYRSQKDANDITKRELKFSHSVCSEQDVADAISKYNNGEMDLLGEYISGKAGDENYSNDGKCMYIELLWFKLFGDPSGYDWYSTKLSGVEDKEDIVELIRRDNGPTIESLNLRSSSNEAE